MLLEGDLRAELLGGWIHEGLLVRVVARVFVTPQVQLEVELVLVALRHEVVHRTSRVAHILEVNVDWHAD